MREALASVPCVPIRLRAHRRTHCSSKVPPPGREPATGHSRSETLLARLQDAHECALILLPAEESLQLRGRADAGKLVAAGSDAARDLQR